MLSLVSCIPYDNDACRMPLFGGGATLDMDSTDGNDQVLQSLTVQLDAYHGAELSNIVVAISLPKEVHIGKGGSITDGVIMKTTNDKVLFEYSKELKEIRTLCGMRIDSINNKWSKPIEIDISLKFRQLIKCDSGGMENGRYSKKITLNINPTDGKFYNREGRTDGKWVYVGR